MASCLHCRRPFEPRRAGHVFCTSFCRHRYRGGPHGDPTPAVDYEQLDEQIARLFDESRDPDERVRLDDWHPHPEGWADLDACDTVAKRRRWYLALLEEGRL